MRTSALLPRAFWLNVVAATPLALVAGVVLPMVYGRAFGAATLPADILLLGLLGESVAGLVTAYLYGVGRPGLNSLAIGAGVVVTVVGDLLLIPHYHAVGAAIASACAYATTCATLLVCFAVNGATVAFPAVRTGRLAELVCRKRYYLAAGPRPHRIS